MLSSLAGVAPLWLWIVFLVVLAAALAVDLAAHREAHEIGFREALWWSVGWIVLSLAFGAVVYGVFGTERALEFLAGYLVEKSLSVDNIFVFVLLFEGFAVPRRLQHRVLFWGVFGAIVMRAGFIFAGAALLARFEWVMYVFGVLLLVTGWRLLAREHAADEFEENAIVRGFRRVVPVTADYRGARFWVVENGRRLATPLLVALVAVETVDIVFAIDSIPAIFAITRNPFIVLTSNIFAILGLRALYFLVGGALLRLRHLRTGLALVLLFIGAKMLLASFYHVSAGVSMLVIVVLIGGAALLSLRSA
ncbi:MAG TPA: TerC family protein [Vicinamibacterales bacterium]|nr:TerC family protein [Vicinamibacterales bacterium]